MFNKLTSELISSRMEDLNLTKADVSRKIGVSQTAVNNWVIGKSEPTGEFYRKLIILLGLYINKKGQLELKDNFENKFIPMYNISEPYTTSPVNFYKADRDADIIINVDVFNTILPHGSKVYCKKINSVNDLSKTKVAIIVIDNNIQIEKILCDLDGYSYVKKKENIRLKKEDIKYKCVEIVL